jgi:Thioredoxin-like proteins and domains
MYATDPDLRASLLKLGRAVLRRAGVVDPSLPDAYGTAPTVGRAADLPAPVVAPLTDAALDAAAEEAIRAAGLDTGSAGGLDTLGGLPLTRANVEAVLDEMVRPALNADGGDIQLVSIEGQDIHGSCRCNL